MYHMTDKGNYQALLAAELLFNKEKMPRVIWRKASSSGVVIRKTDNMIGCNKRRTTL